MVVFAPDSVMKELFGSKFLVSAVAEVVDESSVVNNLLTNSSFYRSNSIIKQRDI